MKCDFFTFFASKIAGEWNATTWEKSDKVATAQISFLRQNNKSLRIDISVILHSKNSLIDENQMVMFFSFSFS